jgi:GAF domain-containing protein
MHDAISASGKKQAESLNQVLVTLNTLAQALVAIEDPRQTLEEIARSAQQILGADIVDLYQYDQAHDEFILPPIQVGKRRHNDLVITKVYPDDVSARVVKLGTPHYFPKSQDADMLTGKFETPRVGGPSRRFVFREEIISSAVLPLAAADEIVGIMFVNYRDQQAFSQEQRHLIESFANLAAIAIYNARLLKSEQNRRQQSETFQAITQLVSSTAVFEDIANSLLAELGKILDYDSASIQLFEGDRRILVGGRGFLKGDAPYELRRNVSEDPLISQIVQDRRPMVLSDVSNEPLWEHIPQTERVQSWMGVPFIFKDQVLGLLTLDHTEIGYYTHRSEDVAVAFASQVASAIYNSKQTQALAELNRLMHQLIALEESPQGVRRLLEQIAESALEVLKADIVDIYEYVQHEDRFELPRIRVGDVRVSPIDTSDINESSSVFELIQREAPLYEDDTLNNPIFSNDYPEDREPRFEKRFAVREGIRSTAVVPLRSVDETVGLMFASYRMPQAFTSDQKERIELFANQAAVAIHNARLYEQRIRDVEALQRISAAITSEQWSESTDLSRILHLIAEELMEVFNAASCAIRLYNSNTHQFTDRISAGLLQDKVPYEPRADGASEYLIEAKRAIFAENSKATIGDSDRPAIREEFQEAGVASIAYLPLVSGEDVIGALYVNWDIPRQFSENTRRVLWLFADQAVNAIKSAQLLQELAQRAALLERLQEVTTAISAVTSDVEDVLHLIVRRINDVFPETSCEIRLYDPIQEKFTKERVAAGILEKEVDYVPREGGTSAHVVKRRSPFYAESITERLSDGTPAIRERIASQGVQAVATLPLVSKGNVIGTLYVYWFEPHPFTDNDKQVLELFADHAAIAITNTQMYSDLQQRQRDLTLLNEASRTFSSKLDLEEVLTRVLDQVRELLGIVASSIWLIDPETKKLVCRQASGPEYERVQGWQMNLREGLVGLAAHKGESLVVGDAQTDERHFLDVDQATGLELHSILSVPLKFQGNVIGVLQVLDKAVERFDAADQTLLESLGVSAAIAIENARLFEQIQEQREEEIVEAIHRIGVNIAEVSNLDAILDDLLDDALYLMGKANLGEIRLYEPDTDELVVRASRGQSLEEEFTRNKIGEGITGWVAQHRKSRVVGDVTNLKPPEYLPFLGDTKSEIAVPMLSGNELIGVLNIESPELNAFSEDDLRLLEAIAGQGVIAIENNRLYNRLQKLNRFDNRLAELERVL